jgi:hypothetical protein
MDIYANMPAATGKKQFKKDLRRTLLYTINTQWPTHIRRDAKLYTFPEDVLPGMVPGGYLLVGGADFMTYQEIVLNNFEQPAIELMLADEDDVEDIR